MKRCLFFVITSILGISVVFHTVQSSSAAFEKQTEEILVYSQDFEAGSPPDWSLENGWSVAKSDGGHALLGQGHVWVKLVADPWYDYRYTFKLKLDAGASLHANIRIMAPIRYFIGLSRERSYIGKQTGADQFFHDLSQAGGISSGWHTVEISAQGNSIIVQVDGKAWFKYNDPDPLPMGGIAFESLEGGLVWIDDLQVFVPETEESTLQWVRTGGPLGGLGYDVRMRPDNPDILFVTDALAGAFKSIDGGRSWYPANNGLAARTGATGELIPVFCLTIDPNNNDIVWVGMQFQRGIYKSTDGGESWQKLDQGVVERDLTFRGFSVQPGDSNVVYAAGEVSSWEWSGVEKQGREFDMVKGVVYKTTDGGQNWIKVWEGDNLARYIWIDPRDTNVVYVSTGIFDREAANSDPQKGVPGGVGILKSVDGGRTWQQMNNGLGNLYVGSLFMHPQNPDILLAGTGNVQYNEQNGVYLSTDGGASWKHTLRGQMIEAVEFSTSDPQIAYAGGFGGFYRSEDGGLTWEIIGGGQSGEGGWGSPGIMAGHPIDFMVDPRDAYRIFSNQYGGGNFLSEDGGLTWEPASKGYTGAMIRDIAVDPISPGKVVAASRSGIFVSYNAGEDWLGLSFNPFYSLDWHVIVIDPSNPQHFISGLTCYRNLVGSYDGGLSWQQLIQQPENVRIGFNVVAFAPSNPQKVYAGSTGFYSCGSFSEEMPGAGVYLSTDGGKTWQQSADPIVKQLGIITMAVSPQDENFVIAGSAKQGLYRSNDGGISWNQVSSGLPTNLSVGTVRFHPQDTKTLFAGFSRGGLYQSQDRGESWKHVTGGLIPEGNISDLVFDPTNPSTIYLADVSSGVYRSQDGGSTWRTINQGLELRAINTIDISQDGLHLYAGSEGMGVFRLDLNQQPPAPQPTPREFGQPAASSILPTSPPAVTKQPAQVLQTPLTEQPQQGVESPASEKPGIGIPCFGELIPIGLMLVLPVIAGRRLKK